MNISGLSFNALPPISLPFRFFITAPLFVIAIAVLILYSGENLWLSRWQPSMLAMTHGFTLGFITSIMMGALLQLLPVLGGVGFAKPRVIVSACHALYVLGVACLLANFLWPSKGLTIATLIFLGLGIGGYICAASWVLLKKLSQGDAIVGIRLAVFTFVIVLILGLYFQFSVLGITDSFFTKSLTNIHALWGLAGWAGLLIISVSFQVIPMFHVAPNFPKLISRYIPWLIISMLLVFIFFSAIALSLLFLFYAAFAIALLFVIHQRKRKVPDTSIRYWQVAAISLLLLNVLYFLPDNLFMESAFIESSFIENIRVNKVLLMAAIFIYFYLVAVIQGMLLKILPFLSYTHLQQRCLINFSAMEYIPHMHKFLKKKHGVWLFYLHLISGISLLITIIFPEYYWLFGGLLIVEFTWLLVIMLLTMRVYFLVDKKISMLEESR